MIKKNEMVIVRKKQLAKDTYEFILQNEYVANHAKPGQFLHILVEPYTLRRPISIASVDEQNKTVTIIFKIFGEGTKALSNYKEKDSLDCLGPSGNSFPYNHSSKKTILLVGGGIGIPPLYYLGQKLKEQDVNIVSVLGFRSKEEVYYEEKFNAFGKTYITTDDGTYGKKGLVTDVCKKLTNIDQYYSVGPIPMLQSVMQTMQNIKGYISLEERMGCGIGACYACVIRAKEGAHDYYKICEDGPVFNINEVAL